MTRRGLLVVFVLLPLVSTTALWVSWLIDIHDGRSSLVAHVPALLPAFAGHSWGVARAPTRRSVATLLLGVPLVTLLLVALSLWALLVLAGLGCPPDASDCPI